MTSVSLENVPGQEDPNANVAPEIAQKPTSAPADNSPAKPSDALTPASDAPATPGMATTKVTPISVPGLDGVDPHLSAAVKALISMSGGRIRVSSGYRTLAQQTALYNKLGPTLAAAPGTSNHEKGLAVDLEGDVGLIAKLAPQVGLVQPMGWEPWHVELPGTHTTAHPAAYTPSPYGDPNPTEDKSLAASPQYQLASFATAARNLVGQVNIGGEVDSPTVGAGTTAGGAADGLSTPSGGSGAANYSTAPGQGQGGAVKPADLYKMLVGEGLDPVHAAALVSIAGRESGYNPSAHNGNASTGDNSFGLFQINLLNGMHSQFSPEMLSTAQGSAQAAAQLVKAGGLSAWGPYKGMSWSNGTNLQTGVDASGGQVSLAQLEGIVNEGLH